MTRTDARELGTAAGRAVTFLAAPVDAAWLAAVRVLLGVVLAVSMTRFLANGWVERFFLEPTFHFKYWGFEWVEPLPAPLLYGLFVLLVALALGVAAGFAFRFCACAFALGLVYIQLIDVSTYLNHYYLAALLALLLAISPAHRALSVDAWLAARFRRGRGSARQAGIPTIPRAWLWLFRFQVGLVYVFAGLAKAQSDWLIHAQPLRIWLGAQTSLPLLGPLFTLPAVPLVFAWCGFLFDSTIVLFLSFRPTRPFAYAVVVVFHVLTRLLFPIGMFPAIMIVSALVFFPPEWPRLLLAKVQSFVAAGHGRAPLPSLPLSAERPSARFTVGLALGVAYCLVQLALPLRFLAYGGDVLWDERGMRFSWRVMLRAKGGNTTFVVQRKDSPHPLYVNPRSYLTSLQELEMSNQPDLIVQLARYIRDDFTSRGLGPVEVHAESRVSLNGRRSAPFIDPTVDLAEVDPNLGVARVVLPPPTQPPPHTRPVL